MGPQQNSYYGLLREGNCTCDARSNNGKGTVLGHDSPCPGNYEIKSICGPESTGRDNRQSSVR